MGKDGQSLMGHAPALFFTMKIEGIAIQIIAGPYVYPKGEDDPAYIDPVFVENGEITIGDMNYVPIMEIERIAKNLAYNIQTKQIKMAREIQYGIKGDSSDQH